MMCMYMWPVMGEGMSERECVNTLFDLVSSSHGPPGQMGDAHMEDDAEMQIAQHLAWETCIYMAETSKWTSARLSCWKLHWLCTCACFSVSVCGKERARICQLCSHIFCVDPAAEERFKRALKAGSVFVCCALPAVCVCERERERAPVRSPQFRPLQRFSLPDGR